MIVDRKPTQGIEDSQPVEVSLGVVAAGSAEHYLLQAIKDDGFQVTSRSDDAKGTLEFSVGVKDVLEVVTLVNATKKRPKFETLTAVLGGCCVTVVEIQRGFGDIESKLLAEMNLVAAVRNYEKKLVSGSVAERVGAWGEYLRRKTFASKGYGILNIDARNHMIELVGREYQAAKQEIKENSSTEASRE